MTITQLRWDAIILGKRNMEGIPNPPTNKFREIFDLNYICEQSGGEAVYTLRLPFGPYTTGQLDNHSETLYRLEDFLVHNAVRGWHPNWTTRVFSEGRLPEHEIIRRFNSYYGRNPNMIINENQTLEQAEAAILQEMSSHQHSYDTRDSPMRLIAKIAELAPPDEV